MKRLAAASALAILLASPVFAQVGDGRLTGGGSEDLAKIETMDPTPLYNRAVEYIQAKNCTRAVPRLREVLEKRDSDPASNYMMGIAQIGLNDLAEARRYLSRAVSEKPDLADALGRLSYVEAKLGDAANAAEHRGDLLALKTKCAGVCAEGAAINAAIAVADAPPGPPSARPRCSTRDRCAGRKKYAEADAAFGSVLAAKPDDWEAAYMRGQGAARHGQSRRRESFLRDCPASPARRG